jgi:hypothetical protein
MLGEGICDPHYLALSPNHCLCSSHHENGEEMMTEEQYRVVVCNTRLNIAIDLLREVFQDMGDKQEEVIKDIDLLINHIHPLEAVANSWWKLYVDDLES